MSDTQHKLMQRTAVEQIVRQVLAELRAGRPSAKSADTPAGAGQLSLNSKVVSTAELAGRLNGISHLIVPRGAIVTPAARDELRKHRVTIASAVSPEQPAKRTVLHVAAVGTDFNPAPLWQALLAEGFRLEPTVSGEVVAAIEVLSAAAAQGRAVLLVTQRVATALSVANRASGVRAALATNASAVEAAIAEIGANFLVLDPAGRSVFEMRQLVRTWQRRGPAVCPAHLTQQLN